MPDKLPVTIVTGFLGAGKTTLIQHIFNSLPEHRFAMIENEFAQAGVDGAALDGTSATLYELNEGCVCCTVQQDLLRILQDILEQRDDFDHILIETTGLAEPEPILRLFQQPPLSKHLTLNGLARIDGQHVEETLQETSTCAEQITYADLILLNKTDTLTGVDQERIIAQLRQLNPLAETIPIEKGAAPVHRLMELDGARRQFSDRSPATKGHAHHVHDSAVTSVSLETNECVDVDALDIWLGELARSRDPHILRMKGVLALPNAKRAYIFNAVRSTLDVSPGPLWGSNPPYTRLVLIGKGLNFERQNNAFLECLLPS